MAKYRRKPIVIDAEQLTEGNLENLENWCGGSIKGTRLHRSERVIDVQTLAGEVRVNIGDWIICGIRGEFYPCKPDIFKATYEKVTE